MSVVIPDRGKPSEAPMLAEDSVPVICCTSTEVAPSAARSSIASMTFCWNNVWWKRANGM
jgi:hypothetical protein